MNAHEHRQAAIQHRLYGSVNRIKWQPSDIDRIVAKLANADFASSVERLLPPDPADTSTPVVSDAPVSAGGRSFTFTISTEKVDSYNDVISVDGWDLKTHASNPVILWAHDGSMIPIGRATRTWVAGKRLKSTVEIAPASANPLAEQVRQMIAGGFLKATSVGFAPLAWDFAADQKNRPGGLDFKKARLLEWSVVTVPANSDCMIDAGQVGKAIDDQARRLADVRRLSVPPC